MQRASLLPKRENLLLLAFVGVVTALVTSLVERAGGPSVSLRAYLPNVRFYGFALLAYVLLAVPYLLVRHRPAAPTRFLLSAAPARQLWTAILAGIPLLLAVGFFMPTFALMKSSIPLFNGYDWDATLISLDRTIHGTDPWRLLQPVLGYPIVTAALSKAYHAWFLLIYAGALFFSVMVKDRTLRCRYFTAYFLTWTTVGMALAVGMASVGPCFAEPLLGNQHFAEQMAYLRAADRQYPVTVLQVQSDLITWYRMGDFGLGRGISAMPSMHVALAFLFFLAMRKLSRVAGWFFGAFCFLIAIASVHLGYHYAVDGYVSIAVVSAIWWLSGKLTPWMLGPERELAEPVETYGVPAQA